jgi:DNA-binding transcriptional MerR regulator
VRFSGASFATLQAVEEAANNRNYSGWTTTAAAAKALGVSPRTIRLYIERGELEGQLESGTDKRIWLVSIDSLNTLRAKRGTGGIVPDESPEIAESVPEAMRDLALRLESRAAEAAELRTRLELTAQTQSTIEAERKQLEEALQREQERAEKLQAELEAERSKGFWRRLFGEG